MKVVIIAALVALLVFAIPAFGQVSTAASVTVLCYNASLRLITDKAFYEPAEVATITVNFQSNETAAFNATLLIELYRAGALVRTLVSEDIEISPETLTKYWNRDFVGVEPGDYTMLARLTFPTTNTTIADCLGVLVQDAVNISIVPPPIIVIPPLIPPLPPVPPPAPPVIAPIPPPMIFLPLIPPEPGLWTLPERTGVLLKGAVTDGMLAPGSVALVLSPVENYTAEIVNVSEVDALALGRLARMQRVLASYEINVTADLIYYCMNYQPYLDRIAEDSIYIYKYHERAWQPLPTGAVWSVPELDTICGNITMAGGTPYAVLGFTTVMPITTNETAKAAILAAERLLGRVSAIGLRLPLAESLLAKAWNAWWAWDYDLAKALADQAFIHVLIVLLPLLLLLLVALALMLWYLWRKTRKFKFLRRTAKP
jgi:hypothetical protein